MSECMSEYCVQVGNGGDHSQVFFIFQSFGKEAEGCIQRRMLQLWRLSAPELWKGCLFGTVGVLSNCEFRCGANECKYVNTKMWGSGVRFERRQADRFKRRIVDRLEPRKVTRTDTQEIHSSGATYLHRVCDKDTYTWTHSHVITCWSTEARTYWHDKCLEVHIPRDLASGARSDSALRPCQCSTVFAFEYIHRSCVLFAWLWHMQT